jgi:hypothetical protein
LVGGRCAAAAFYPLPLLKAILRGIRDQALIQQKAEEEEEEEFVGLLNALSTGGTFALESKLPEIVMPKETKKSNIKKVSGGYFSIAYDNWKQAYTDEYTGENLLSQLAHDAMIDELDYLNEHVWEVESLDKV